MVTSIGAFLSPHHRGSTKLAHRDDQDIIEFAAFFQVAYECGEQMIK